MTSCLVTKNYNPRPLSSFPDEIIGNYYPGDTVVIIVSQPASLTISPKNMAIFLSGILLRGILDDSFYIFCHGLRSIYNVTPKYETVISCAELLSAIKRNITHCGLLPQLNG
ncbi:hypothetical protein DAPPUDRAFT_324731 [Daphnia pulex]|uniref:Uncharacterized protein n=1 Tax=Daphnia pulex TaxID=6669 RepID=E9H2K1_DAPPU|nr:hypothetical protein DAPPUDRAFT_324731 [Daphnia pulex]|eukprot:EFX73987.1 hypothetical protein DAPPUDRAFT_324731 [Daphnia pulex]